MTMSPSTNPYTAHLLAQLPPAPPRPGDVDVAAIAAFVADWDRLETLVIRVFRAGAAGAEDAAAWTPLRASLAASYPPFAADLAAHWPLTRVAAQPCAADPFRSLLDIPSAAAIVGDWAAMQTLPSAREALNRWLVAMAAGPPA
ncbi:MAG: hypothetical protein ABI780_08665 [Ardenticatenales bacterium]